MIYLCCYIASSIAFHQLFRFGQQKKTDVLSTAAVNYSVAAVLTLAWYLIAGHGEIDRRLIVYGLCNGIVYYVSLPVLLRAFQLAGVGVTVAVLFTSNLPSVIIAFLLWDEPVTNMQWIALVLVPVAIFLVRPRDGGAGGGIKGGVKADVLLVLIFIMGSVMMTTHKAASRIVENDSELLYNASELDTMRWFQFGKVRNDGEACVLQGAGWDTMGLVSRQAWGPGTIFEVDFTCSRDSEFALHVGAFGTRGNYFVQFLTVEEGYGIGCYLDHGPRRTSQLSWTPNKKHRAKIEITSDGYRFYLDVGQGYQLAGKMTGGQLPGGQVGFQQRSGRGVWDNVRIAGLEIEMPKKVFNEPDVVVHFRDTYAAFADIIRLHNGNLQPGGCSSARMRCPV